MSPNRKQKLVNDLICLTLWSMTLHLWRGLAEKLVTGSTRRRQWQPTPVLLPGKSHGQRSLVGCSLWGR